MHPYRDSVTIINHACMPSPTLPRSIHPAIYPPRPPSTLPSIHPVLHPACPTYLPSLSVSKRLKKEKT